MTTLLDFIGERTIQERFIAFHERNPVVLAKLVELARYAKSRGKRVGIRLLWERLRWSLFIEQDPHEDFALNDHFHARYARLIVETYPAEFQGYFEFRKLKAE